MWYMALPVTQITHCMVGVLVVVGIVLDLLDEDPCVLFYQVVSRNMIVKLVRTTVLGGAT